MDSVASLSGDPNRTDEFIEDVFSAEESSLVGNSDFTIDLAKVLSDWNSPATVSEALDVWTLITPNAAVLELISSLRVSGLTISLASNQQRHRAGYMINHLGYERLFDHLFFSYDLGHKKPSKEYFIASLSRLEMEPSEVLFIDDHQANVDSALGVGLNSERFHLSMGIAKQEEVLNQYGVQTTPNK
jgi:putative hydrolase of the HAD superfamily